MNIPVLGGQGVCFARKTWAVADAHLGLARSEQLLRIGVPQGQVLPALCQQRPHLLQALLAQLCRICASSSPM